MKTTTTTAIVTWDDEGVPNVPEPVEPTEPGVWRLGSSFAVGERQTSIIWIWEKVREA